MLAEPKIIIRLVDLELMSSAVFINRECHKAAREIVFSAREPVYLKRVVVPMVEIKRSEPTA